MKKTMYLILLLFAQIVVAQTTEDYESTLENISEGYNAKNASQIFDLFSEDLKTTFTLDLVKTFIEENYTDKGDMGEATFLLDGEGDKRYLVEFENISSIIILSITSDKKISKLALEEY